MPAPTFWNVISVIVTVSCLVLTGFLALRKAPIERNNMTSSTVANLTRTVNDLLDTVEQLRKAQRVPQHYTIEVQFISDIPPTIEKATIRPTELIGAGNDKQTSS
jgi:hypothetical protein